MLSTASILKIAKASSDRAVTGHVNSRLERRVNERTHLSQGGTAASDEFRHHPRADRAVAWTTVGGLIVHWFSWREIFFVNVPAGVVALWLIHRYMPDYYGDASHPLDVMGLAQFGAGTAVLSWLLEIFGEHVV